jgi:hypothetical protein
MALRLSESVVCGELMNTRRNSVHGWLRLRGVDQLLSLQLTGNCSADLSGRHIRFEVRERLDAHIPECFESEEAALERLKLTGLAWQQIGPTGTMTAARMVRVSDCPPGELYIRTRLGEPPPQTRKRCLYLEWYSQNGRVVVELVDPIIEFIQGDVEDDPPGESADHDDSAETDMSELGEAGLGITSIQFDDEGDVEMQSETLLPEDGEEPFECHDSLERDDHYGLIPEELQQAFDAAARETDRSLFGDSEEDADIRELELMDDLIESGPGDPLSTILGDTVKLPKPAEVDDRRAEQELKLLLARLALYGIALDICEHFTAAEAYRVLVERIGPEECAYPELRGTQWVQHYSTSDFCQACQAEFDLGV